LKRRWSCSGEESERRYFVEESERRYFVEK